MARYQDPRASNYPLLKLLSLTPSGCPYPCHSIIRSFPLLSEYCAHMPYFTQAHRACAMQICGLGQHWRALQSAFHERQGKAGLWCWELAVRVHGLSAAEAYLQTHQVYHQPSCTFPLMLICSAFNSKLIAEKIDGVAQADFEAARHRQGTRQLGQCEPSPSF